MNDHPAAAEGDAFDAEQRRMLQETPIFVIGGAVASHPDGLRGSMREMIDGIEAFARAIAAADEPILTQLFQTIDPHAAGDFSLEEATLAETNARLMERGIADARAAVELLSRQAGAEVAEVFASALLAGAEAAAAAVRTGGLLGIGSHDISREEAAYLARLSQAVGRPAGDGA